MITYAKSINRALDKKVEDDDRVILLGEDIRDPYGGAFKITKGLSTKYPDRVINTPMSEYALTGIAAGLALRGMRPVLEIMFGDFLTICADQLINHAAKFSWMYNDKVKVPMVIRAPMGGRRGYGPTHSQTLEKIFLGIPGLKVIAPSHLHEPGELLIKAIDDDNPVLFIENKQLYPRQLEEIKNGHVLDFAARKSEDEFETVTISSTGFEEDQATILTYGGMLPYAIEAVSELLMEKEVGVEVVIPSYINRGLIDDVLESLRRTKRLIIVEEGTLFNGWGAEMAAQVAEAGFELLASPIKRVAAKDLPIGSCRAVEEGILPQAADIKKVVKKAIEECCTR